MDAQEIQWATDISWEQVKDKAKKENRYIFVDCYTTWCVACKKMDSSVFLQSDIVNVLNEKFVSVKIQFDTSKNDSKQAVWWHANANEIRKHYGILNFPTYLFFSPSGEIVHRDQGFKSGEEFVVILTTALDTNKQYYTLLQKYLKGQKNYGKLPYLAKYTKELDFDSLANCMARDYINNYLLSTKADSFFSQKNLMFINSFISAITSQDTCFQLIYLNNDRVDSAINHRGFAQYFTDFIITKEEINPIIKKGINGKSPNWGKGYKSIKRKFGQYVAERNVLSAKMSYYDKKADWKRYNKSAIKRITKYPLDTMDNLVNDVILNNIAWFGIFLHSNKKSEISAAIKWMEGVIRRRPESSVFLDTYANLLYKAGKRKQAILSEEKALVLDPNAKDVRNNLSKMKRGDATWVD
ncbi:thioredoxin family protein [Longitalea arenae]|uniref:thioredoxin family protein n=1 Tax=Longitalea arenae TaxID=2812558 RepID=UPI0019678137|nr:thioredoxin fold domain-containing protein [Longitalea arenae]